MSPLLPTSTAAKTLPLWFDVPAEFTRIDLAATPEERAAGLIEQLTQAIPDASPEQRLHLALAREAVIARMLEAGAVYAATLLARTDEAEPPRLITAQFTVLVSGTDGTDTATLEATADRLSRDDIQRDVGMVALPAGEALGVIEDDQVTLPSSVFGEPGEETHRTRQAQLTLPFPDGKRLATFALSTECLTDWNDLLEIFAGIARTISFHPPGGGAITRALHPAAPASATSPEPGPPRRSISDALAGNTD
jgi:hypothetical protein